MRQLIFNGDYSLLPQRQLTTYVISPIDSRTFFYVISLLSDFELFLSISVPQQSSKQSNKTDWKN